MYILFYTSNKHYFLELINLLKFLILIYFSTILFSTYILTRVCVKNKQFYRKRVSTWKVYGGFWREKKVFVVNLSDFFSLKSRFPTCGGEGGS